MTKCWLHRGTGAFLEQTGRWLSSVSGGSKKSAKFSKKKIGSEALVERCRALVGRINASANACGAFEDQTCWTGVGGTSIYRPQSIQPTDIDVAFLNCLRLERQIFSGEFLEPALLRLPRLPSWLLLKLLTNDQVREPYERWRIRKGMAPLDWSVLEFARIAVRLPKRYRCEMPIDNGGARIGRYLANRETAAYQERLSLLHKSGAIEHLRSQRNPTILEIGSGFGALAYCVKRILPRSTYILVDLPQSLVHSACWLAQWANGDIDVYERGDLPRSDFVLVPHTAIEGLEDVTIDLAINTLSFAEMEEQTVSQYASFLKDHLRKSGILFEQNFDNTSSAVNSFCNPAPLLSRFFSQRTIISADSWRGVASVWRV